MKQPTEVTRFLNYVNNAQNKIKDELNHTIAIKNYEIVRLQTELQNANRTLQSNSISINALDTDNKKLLNDYNKLLSSVTKLIPKLRVNIYENNNKCTPRFFKTGKWWSRETGGLMPDFVSDLIPEEIQEVIEFYGTTELPLMLPKSKRQIKEES